MCVSRFLKCSLAGVAAVVLVACGGGGSGEESPSGENIKQQLIDSPLAGVAYYCDGRGMQKTTITGEFTCDEPPVTFKIGKLVLGTINRFTLDGKFFPQDLVGVSRDDLNNTRLIDLIRLLQSLDADGVIDEAIEIPGDMAEKFDDNSINSKTLQGKANLAGVALVSKEDAMDHLTNSMIHVRQDIGQFGLDRMKLWMSGCWYKHGQSRDSYGVTLVQVQFQEGKVKIGTSGGYIFPYEFYENQSFKMYTPDGMLTMNATGLGQEYYQDSVSDKKDIISFWATEKEAKDYQSKVGDISNPYYRTCTIGASELRPLPQ